MSFLVVSLVLEFLTLIKQSQDAGRNSTFDMIYSIESWECITLKPVPFGSLARHPYDPPRSLSRFILELQRLPWFREFARRNRTQEQEFEGGFPGSPTGNLQVKTELREYGPHLLFWQLQLLVPADLQLLTWKPSSIDHAYHDRVAYYIGP